jgi:hypothetical protein
MECLKHHRNSWENAYTCALVPKAKEIDFKSLGLNLDIDFVSFQHSFYQEAFREITLAESIKRMLALRVCAFIDLKNDENNKLNIPLMQSFASRFVSLLFTDKFDHEHLYPQEAPHDAPNYDVQTIYF